MEFSETQKDNMFHYLDKLHSYGVTGVFAERDLAQTFDLTQGEAHAVRMEWMSVFAKRHPRE